MILIVELAPTGGTIQSLFGWEHPFPLKDKGQFAFLKCEEGCHIQANLLRKKSANIYIYTYILYIYMCLNVYTYILSHIISGWSPGLVPDWATRHSFVDLGCKEPRLLDKSYCNPVNRKDAPPYEPTTPRDIDFWTHIESVAWYGLVKCI